LETQGIASITIDDLDETKLVSMDKNFKQATMVAISAINQQVCKRIIEMHFTADRS